MAGKKVSLLVEPCTPGRFVPAFRQLRLTPRGRLQVGHFNAWVETFALQL